MGKQRVFTREFKLGICRKLDSGELSKTRAMREHRLGAGTIERWVLQYKERGENAFDGSAWRAPASAETMESRLRKQLDQALLEVEFLRACLGKPARAQEKE